MKKYKVLRLVNGELISPHQNYNYGKLEDVLEKKLVCENFDDDEYMECANGFYATDIDGLIYSLNNHKDNRVFEVEVGGKSVIYDEYKQRFKKQTIVKMLSKSEVRKLIKEQSKKMDWDYYHACYPVNPLKINKPFNKEKALRLLREWVSVSDFVWESVSDSVWDSVNDSVSDSVWDSVGDSVWDSVRLSVGASVRDSVWDSVRDSVWDSVRDSVWGSVGDSVCASVWDSVRDSVRASVGASVRDSVNDSVWDSVGDSVRAYISSLFPSIKKWKYINHKECVNPFQSGIDLWHMGLIPSFDGNVWRLHKGKNAEVVLEIAREELREVKE